VQTHWSIVLRDERVPLWSLHHSLADCMPLKTKQFTVICLPTYLLTYTRALALHSCRLRVGTASCCIVMDDDDGGTHLREVRGCYLTSRGWRSEVSLSLWLGPLHSSSFEILFQSTSRYIYVIRINCSLCMREGFQIVRILRWRE